MTDKKDKEGKILIGPWGEPTTKNSDETKKWVKEKYDSALERNNSQLKMKLSRNEYKKFVWHDEVHFLQTIFLI